ncbi:polysaccharide pyruvyl transferase CsaB [Sporanaerobium hydrogeniformans]|uniref:Polysaccharide pyruvyl transferase CsaB n=1 Tax=Sporanaerobium hydrogeniformans TaxID=3072179 RepID=A0AC61DDY8_9FIRM|nr:polysaccharide pyruvyl transferase CsaB [Sporanaerobium hydrogeniformans]PHV71283.1 polysaccharide pyruvyl transferase CsaB [Sporanaerobium hydrogeniformans]
MIDVLISGFYGFRNSGDDAILLGMVQELKRVNPQIKIAVLSKTPEKTKEIYGVEAISRFNILEVIKVMKRSRLFISGGGSLIQDVTSTRSLLYYLGLIRLAHFLGVRVMLYANGIGPIKEEKNRKLCKKILDKVSLITLREPMSKEEIESLGITQPRIEVTADPAMLLKEVEGEKVKLLLKEIGVVEEKPIITLSVRPWGENIEEYTQVIAQAADEISRKYDAQILLAPLQMSQDFDVCEQVASKMQAPSYLLKREYHITELLAIIKASDLMIGMRLHALIYAVSMCVPIVGIVYDPKVEGLLRYTHQHSAGAVEELHKDKLLSVIEEVWTKRQILKKELQDKKPEFECLARKNTEEVIKLIASYK